MDIHFEKTSDCRAELRAVVPAADVQQKKNAVLAAYARHAHLAGFRPGKVPTSVVAKHFAKEIADQLHDEFASAVQQQLFEDNPKLKVLEFSPFVSTDLEDGACELTSTLTIIPEFDLPDYEHIAVTVPGTEVSDDEVQDTMQKYAEASATFDSTSRAAAKGDAVVIDFKTTVEGVPVAEHAGRTLGWIEGREDYRFTLGEDDYIPGLADGLVGMSAGESKDIVCPLGEDFVIKELAGKEVTFCCVVKDVLEKSVPEITAELFEAIMPGKTLDEVREVVRENLKSAKERSNDEAKADQISEKLGSQLSFALPEDLVERELNGTLQRKIYAAIQGGNYEIAKDMDALRAEARTETERNLRVFFALQEIAERENVQATDQEVMQQIAEMARKERETNMKTYVRKLQRDGRITGIRLSIITSKVMDLLVRRAEVTTEPAAEAEPAAETPAE